MINSVHFVGLNIFLNSFNKVIIMSTGLGYFEITGQIIENFSTLLSSIKAGAAVVIVWL